MDRAPSPSARLSSRSLKPPLKVISTCPPLCTYSEIRLRGVVCDVERRITSSLYWREVGRRREDEIRTNVGLVESVVQLLTVAPYAPAALPGVQPSSAARRA